MLVFDSRLRKFFWGCGIAAGIIVTANLHFCQGGGGIFGNVDGEEGGAGFGGIGLVDGAMTLAGRLLVGFFEVFDGPASRCPGLDGFLGVDVVWDGIDIGLVSLFFCFIGCSCVRFINVRSETGGDRLQWQYLKERRLFELHQTVVENQRHK